MVDYTAGAAAAGDPTTGAGDPTKLVEAINDLLLIAQSERSVATRLVDAEAMWKSAADATGQLPPKLGRAIGEVESTWTGKDFEPFKGAMDKTVASVTDSVGEMGPAAAAINRLPPIIENTIKETTKIQTDLVADYNTLRDSLSKSYNPYSGGGGVISGLSAADLKADFIKKWQPEVVRAGAMLNSQAMEYGTTATRIELAARKLRWVGPKGNQVGPATAPGGGPATEGTPQGGGPAQSPSGGAPATDPGAGGQPPAGGPQSEAGGEQPPGGQEQPAGNPSGPGLDGTLAPPATMPPGLVPPATSLPPSPPAGMPPVTPGGIPYAPLTPAANGGGVRLPTGGSGRVGDLGGSSGLGRLGDSKPAGPVGTSDQSIAQAARPGSSASPGSGQAPAAPAVPGTGSGAGGQAGGGVPPMMPPPGMAGAGGGGKAGKPGSGAIRPVGRERHRATGAVPGVPGALRGKTAKSAGIGAAPVASRSRRDDEPLETLQLLDEELWTVNETAAAPAAPSAQQVRRVVR